MISAFSKMKEKKKRYKKKKEENFAVMLLQGYKHPTQML